jgi:hypothetical protein
LRLQFSLLPAGRNICDKTALLLGKRFAVIQPKTLAFYTNLPVPLYRRGTRSDIAKENHRLKMYKNIILRKISEFKGGKCKAIAITGRAGP